LQLTAPPDQRVAVREGVDEPLAAGHDLDRAIALLEELHRASHRLGVADELAGLREQLDHPAARLVDRLAPQLPRAGARALDVLGLPAGGAPGNVQQPAVGPK